MSPQHDLGTIVARNDKGFIRALTPVRPIAELREELPRIRAAGWRDQARLPFLELRDTSGAVVNLDTDSTPPEDEISEPLSKPKAPKK